MQQYLRYILFKIAGLFLLITLSLTFLVWLTQSLRFVDLIVNRGLGASTFLYLSTLLLPSLLSIVLPIALFISIAFVYSKLTMDSELIVLKSAGLSKIELIKPALYAGVVATIIGYTISLWLLPASYREFKDMQSFIRDNYISSLLQEGVFNNPVKGLTVYIREIHDDGALKGILVHDNRNMKRPVTMMAEGGQLVNAVGGPRFILANGNRQEISQEDGHLSLLYFERYALDIASYANTREYRWREPEERYLSELFWPEDNTSPNLLQKLRAEGHQRLVWPLYNIVLCLIAVMIFVTGEFNRRGNGLKTLAHSAAAFISLGCSIALNSLTANNPHFAPVMYILIFSLIGVCFYLILRNERGLTKKRKLVAA
ncbi:MAG: LPS export ABC transporter permease LptF [Proteobacteria bacterium]|nr:LPS export ABC transporter permease LptF [Pseudomonadota bacterium]